MISLFLSCVQYSYDYRLTVYICCHGLALCPTQVQFDGLGIGEQFAWVHCLHGMRYSTAVLIL